MENKKQITNRLTVRLEDTHRDHLNLQGNAGKYLRSLIDQDIEKYKHDNKLNYLQDKAKLDKELHKES